MKAFFRIFNHVILVALLFILQIAWIVISTYEIGVKFDVAEAIFSLFSIGVMVYILNQPGDPSIKMVWVVLVLLFPLVGWVLWLLTGGKWPSARLRANFMRAHAEVVAKRDGDATALDDSLSHYLMSQGYPAYRNDGAEYYASGKDAYAAMLDAVSHAEHFVFLEYFIIAEGKMWDGLLRLLKEKVKAGVEVRVMYDAVGSIVSLPRRYAHRLRKLGIQTAVFNRVPPVFSPIVNHRDHRKILIVDGKIAFTGGINIGDEYIGERERFGVWRDNAVSFQGDAVRAMILLFFEMWNTATRASDDPTRYLPEPSAPCALAPNGYIQPYGDSPLDDESLGQNVYLDLICRAKRSIWFSTPYLVIDHSLTKTLIYAAKRGVDVRIITPGVPDKKPIYAVTRSNYAELIAGGVKIYEFTPGFVHAKLCVCDGEVATVGTVNLDYRSFLHHFECGCVFFGGGAVDAVASDLSLMCSEGRQIVKAERSRGFSGMLRSFCSAVLRLFAPLF